MTTPSSLPVFPLLLAGGTGSRLWPLSRELFPKQLIALCGDDSLVQSSIKRLEPLLPRESVRVSCGEEHFFEICRHLEQIKIENPKNKVITEPCGRNTAPAILLSVLSCLKQEQLEDALFLVFPADHTIAEEEKFRRKLEDALSLADEGHIVTFGIKPDAPETGYGYIERDGEVKHHHGAFRIKCFYEKPEKAKAEEYLKSGSYYWNSGMFAFKASTLVEEFRSFEPQMLVTLQSVLNTDGMLSPEQYESLKDISIDNAIMEKTNKGVVLPSEFGWNDIGSWKSLYDHLQKDENKNAIDGDVIPFNTTGSLIHSHGRLIVVNGVKNLVVVETKDTILVTPLEKSEEVKNIVRHLKKEKRPEYIAHATVYRPWGTYTVLEETKNTKLKRIMVYPGKKLSLQLHHHRSEHWVVVKGTARIQNGEEMLYLEENQSTYVPTATKHRLENPGLIPLEIIEVQHGDYLSEDDIVRFDDDYGRCQ